MAYCVDSQRFAFAVADGTGGSVAGGAWIVTINDESNENSKIYKYGSSVAAYGGGVRMLCRDIERRAAADSVDER